MSEQPASPRRRGRPTPPIMLSDDERQTLERWAKRRTSSQALALRCRIVLACAEGLSNVEAGRQLGVHEKTVGKWRTRFLKRRLDGLSDQPRPGVPRTITDAQVEQVITKTLAEQPAGATHWSTRSMARATGMSQTAVSRIWRAFGLKPHLAETWKLSSDPQCIDKVRDLCGLYLNPPEAAVVLGVDEQSQIQALERTAPVLPLLPGSPQRRSHDSTRHGTTNLYAALNLASGLVISQMTPRHRALEFRRFLDHVDQAVPAALAVQVIGDNSSTHTTPAIRRWLVAHPRFQLHFTPTYSSWLNLVERWFAELTTTGRSPSSPLRFRPGSRPGTPTRGRLCGPRPPTRSSTASLNIYSQSLTHDTRASFQNRLRTVRVGVQPDEDVGDGDGVPPGIGKTKLAVGLAIAACQTGYSVCFTSLDGLSETSVSPNGPAGSPRSSRCA